MMRRQALERQRQIGFNWWWEREVSSTGSFPAGEENTNRPRPAKAIVESKSTVTA
jgi:hypothetical protein